MNTKIAHTKGRYCVKGIGPNPISTIDERREARPHTIWDNDFDLEDDLLALADNESIPSETDFSSDSEITDSNTDGSHELDF